MDGWMDERMDDGWMTDGWMMDEWMKGASKLDFIDKGSIQCTFDPVTMTTDTGL